MPSTTRTFLVSAVLLLLAGATFAQTRPFTRTVIVNNTGVPSADGAKLLAAISGLYPPASTFNRWVVKLESGIYDIGSTPVEVPGHVNLVGSGVGRTVVRGSYGPLALPTADGLVQVKSNSEIRDLTIECSSVPGLQDSCQALSVHSGNPRLSNLEINVEGKGTGSHWGIRTDDAAPEIDDIEITVDAGNGFDAYGIVFGGSSAINIKRSTITARNGSNNNWAIAIKDYLAPSIVQESTPTGFGGRNAAGLVYLNASTNELLQLGNVTVQGYGASDVNRGIHEDSAYAPPAVSVRGGRIYGEDDGIVLPSGTVTVVSSEIEAGGFFSVHASVARIGSTWLNGGTVFGGATCAGVFTSTFVFLPDTCP